MFILSLLIWLLAVTIAITIHEYAHAWVADKLGDPTPGLMGRLSINPLDHYDRVGTTLLLVTSLLRSLGYPIIPMGWAKPVQYDPYNLRSPKRDAALIAVAGATANILLAVILGFLLKTFLMEMPLVNAAITAIVTVNVSLAIFNLIPIHPLDGGKVLVGLLPDELAHEYEIIMHQYGFFILMLLLIPFSGTSALSALISPIITTIVQLIL